jgi:hypothetical protein
LDLDRVEETAEETSTRSVRSTAPRLGVLSIQVVDVVR